MADLREHADPPSDEADAFLALCVAYLEGGASGDELKTLETELESSHERRATFVRLCGLRARVIEAVRGDALAPAAAAGEPIREMANGDIRPSLSDAMILPALTEAWEAEDADDAPAAPTYDWRGSKRSSSWQEGGRLHRYAWAATVFCLIAAAVVAYLAHPKRVVPMAGLVLPPATATAPVEPLARLVATIDGVWDDATVRLGGAMPEWPVTLRSGIAELRLSNGVGMIVHGPASLRLTSDRLVDLYSGSLTVNVPPAAQGFAIRTSGARVTDLGTEFGVSLAGEQTEMVVFRGSVRAQAISAGADSNPVVFVAGNGAQVDDKGVSQMTETAALRSAAAYVRDVYKVRQPLQMVATGMSLDPSNGADTRWQVVSRSDRPEEKPVWAYPSYDSSYLPDDAASKWVSGAAGDISAAGTRFTFRTTFDLTGFDPSTVRVKLDLAADDAVEDVLVNGVSAGIRLLQHNVMRLTPFVLEHGFVDGRNQLDIVVVNIGETGAPSPYALRARLDGTAVRRVSTAQSQ